jgi:hypothetical protein
MEKRNLPTNFSFENLFGPKLPGELHEGGYPYFTGIAQQPFQADGQGLNLINALWLSECSLLVYVREREVVEETLQKAGFGEVRCFNFDRQGSQSFVTHNDEIIIVCFRGTEVQELKDVWHDVQFVPVPSGQAGRKTSTGQVRRGGTVHKGFKDAVDNVWAEMETYLNEVHEGQKV